MHRTILVGVALVCGGCFITVGDFDTRQVGRFILGATPRPAVDSLLGAPRDTTAAGGTIIYRYAYSEQDPQPSTPRIDRKLLLVEFVHDTLNGYLYSNSVGELTTDFDENARDSIVAFRSTAADVRRLLGEPPGKTRLPTTLFTRKDYSARPDTAPAGSTVAWSYAYLFTQRAAGGSGYEDVAKQLVVFFDSAGTVAGSVYHGTGAATPWCCPSAITYRLEKTSCVTVELYDITGFLLRVILLDEEQGPGNYTRTLPFDDLPPGVYIARIQIDGAASLRKVMLMR